MQSHRHDRRRRRPPAGQQSVGLSILLLLSALDGGAVLAAPTLTVTERAMEMAIISYRVGSDGYGTATITGCRACSEPLSLRITPDTRLVIGTREIPPRKLPSLERRRATLFYSPEAQRLNRIVLRKFAERE